MAHSSPSGHILEEPTHPQIIQNHYLETATLPLKWMMSFMNDPLYKIGGYSKKYNDSMYVQYKNH